MLSLLLSTFGLLLADCGENLCALLDSELPDSATHAISASRTVLGLPGWVQAGVRWAAGFFTKMPMPGERERVQI